ncbi:MAG: efflux RND transporter permease subunit [Gracilibacteraceae bacterium]|jgi:HAE1 family hydrophobic/amphiphilic exporter-1|nr:efflux RND transporter permease subunit [Gracilibacteraceae bacterium]
MNFSEMSVRRPVTVIMIFLIVILLGAVSLTGIPLDLLPNIEIPIAIVMTTYNGVGPEQIETLITRPIENAVGTVAHIETLQSISSENVSIVVMQFEYNTDLDQAVADARNSVEMLSATMPEDAADPIVMKIDLNAMPMMMLSLSTESMTQTEIQALVEDTVQPQLESVAGVASVEIFGSVSNVVEVRLDAEKLRGYGVSPDYVAGIIRAENMDIPAGSVMRGEQELTVTTNGQFQTVEQIGDMLIPLPTGSLLRLRDLAQVELKLEDPTTISKADGNTSIDLVLTKQTGTNTVAVSRSVEEKLEDIRRNLPKGDITILYDSADYIVMTLNQVAQSALQGALLAVIVLYIFLRNIRTTLIIGLSIPISIIATFCLLFFTDITLNIMTVGGLGLGVGMLVDNSIVVLENIYRHRQSGYSRVDASVKGSMEVNMALVASTLTTVAVFVPIFFAEGIAAMLFEQLAITVSFSLLASLAVAITLVPMLCSKLMKVSVSRHDVDEFGLMIQKQMGIAEEAVTKTRFRPLALIYDAFDRSLAALNRNYGRMLAWALRRRKTVLIIAAVAFILCLASVFVVGQEFFPESDQGFIMVEANLAQGAKVNDAIVIMDELEAQVRVIPEISRVFIEAGSAGAMSGGENYGALYIELLPLKERERGAKEVMEQIRALVSDTAGAEISVSSMSSMNLGGTGAPLNVALYGDDIDALKDIADDLVEIVKTVEGTREVRSSYANGVPKVSVTINRDQASQFGLTAAQVGQSVRNIISGSTATQFRVGGTEIPVVIRGDSYYKENMAALGQMPVSASGQVSLDQLADVAVTQGPISINRIDRETTLSVSAEISGRDLGSVSADVLTALASYNMPEGYRYEMGGMTETMTDAFSDLLLMLVLAVLLVYMIMASQFESLLYPFIIMFSMPLGLAGGVFGLFIAGIPLSVPGLIGIIMLAGIVVNNAIVFVDYVNTRRRTLKEDNRTAVLHAGPIRLRPILMTTLTTVLGMLPMAIGVGTGAEMAQPLALVIVFGLSLSTLVTLIVVPVLYLALDNFGAKFRKKEL